MSTSTATPWCEKVTIGAATPYCGDRVQLLRAGVIALSPSLPFIACQRLQPLHGPYEP